MKVENIEKIKALKAEAAKFGGFHAHFAEKYGRDTSCDKKGYGFNQDDRFAAFKMTVSFDSHAGYYGNSSCSTVLSVHNKDIVQKAFIEALNQNQKLIFATMEKLMLAEAEKLVGAAQEEVSALQRLVDEFMSAEKTVAA